MERRDLFMSTTGKARGGFTATLTVAVVAAMHSVQAPDQIAERLRTCIICTAETIWSATALRPRDAGCGEGLSRFDEADPVSIHWFLDYHGSIDGYCYNKLVSFFPMVKDRWWYIHCFIKIIIVITFLCCALPGCVLPCRAASRQEQPLTLRVSCVFELM